MEYTGDQLKKIVSLGTLAYGVEKCLNILDIEDGAQFRVDFYDSESRVAKAYKKGRDIADFAIDTKLFDKAKAGDLPALKEFDKRKKMRE